MNSHVSGKTKARGWMGQNAFLSRHAVVLGARQTINNWCHLPRRNKSGQAGCSCGCLGPFLWRTFLYRLHVCNFHTAPLHARVLASDLKAQRVAAPWQSTTLYRYATPWKAPLRLRCLHFVALFIGLWADCKRQSSPWNTFYEMRAICKFLFLYFRRLFSKTPHLDCLSHQRQAKVHKKKNSSKIPTRRSSVVEKSSTTDHRNRPRSGLERWRSFRDTNGA